MKNWIFMMLLITTQQPGFAEEFLFDFEDFPSAIFGPPSASGFAAGNVRFFPIRAEDGSIFYHIHAEDINRDGDKELVHHADAGGWFIQPEDEMTPFAVKRWGIEKIQYSNPSGSVQPLVVDGYLNKQKVASIEIPVDTQPGSFEFPSDFGKLDRLEVYFKTWRAKKPADNSEINWNISIDNLVISTVDASTDPPVNPVFPKQGLWWDPARSGHGIDIQFDGANLIAVWYTYHDDGTPTWYLASGPFTGTSWSSRLDTYTWDESKATATPVGSITFQFNDATHANLSWDINGISGREPFEFFVISNDPTVNDYTGVWFEPAKPGYGLSVSTQGNREFSVLYFYDDQGKPRWALGVNDNHAITYSLDQYTQGFCPVCTQTTPVAKMLGTISREFSSQSSGTLSVDFNLAEPLSGAWTIDNAQIINLSNP